VIELPYKLIRIGNFREIPATRDEIASTNRMPDLSFGSRTFSLTLKGLAPADFASIFGDLTNRMRFNGVNWGQKLTPAVRFPLDICVELATKRGFVGGLEFGVVIGIWFSLFLI